MTDHEKNDRYAQAAMSDRASHVQRPSSSTSNLRFVTYLYPRRNARYMAFYEKFRPTDGQHVIRAVFVAGWQQAQSELDQWWSANDLQGLQRYLDWPIPDFNLSSELRARYTIYLKSTNLSHQPIIGYLQSLPTSELRQMFLRMALVFGSEQPNIEQLLALLR